MSATSPRLRTYEILDNVVPGDRAARGFVIGMVAIIVANVIAVAMETVPAYRDDYGTLFTAIEAFSIFIFIVEYVLRLWSCVENRADDYDHPLWGRLRYAVTPLAIIDLLAILPTLLATMTGLDLRILRILRLFSLLKLTRFSPALETIGAVIYAQRKGLLAAMLMVAILMVFSSSLVYLAEYDAQPDKFGTMLDAMWWSIVTLATVGYGDLAPVTPFGRIIGAVTIMLGIGCYALPTGLLASGFADEIRKRDFVVTWRLVAKVPFFARLDADRIAAIAGLLEPKRVPPGYTVMNKGEAADCMYFIVSGEVDVMIVGHPIRLRTGDFFGEIALLKDSVRTATVNAVTDCHLLTLNVAHFRRLLTANPDLKAEIDRVAEERLGQTN